jgi:hypothetical protein
MSDKDVNYLSFADVEGVILENVYVNPELDGLRAADFDDILKLSHVKYFKGHTLSIVGGSENAIDMNRECFDIQIRDSKVFGGGQCAIVIKGGCQYIHLKNLVIADPVGSYDIELGGWSDQSAKITRKVTLENVTRSDGKPVRLVLGHAEHPEIIGGNVKVLNLQSIVLQVFILIKSLFKKRGSV